MRFGDHAASGVDCQLLHGAIDRCGEAGEVVEALRLVQFLLKRCRFLLGLMQQVEHRSAVLRQSGFALLPCGLVCRGEFDDSAFLLGELTLLLHLLLLFVQVMVLGHQAFFRQARIVGGDALGNRQYLFQLAGGLLGGVYFCAALRDQRFLLGLGAMQLLVLACQPAIGGLLLCDSGLRQSAGHIGGRVLAVDGVEHGLCAHRIHLAGEQVAAQALDVGAGLAAVQFDQ